MIPAALEWFADLCTRYAYAPPEAQLLGNELLKQFSSSNERVQVNRAFRRHLHILDSVNKWLCSGDLCAAVEKTNCTITSTAHVIAQSAVTAMLSGQVPSAAWGMGAQRGVDTGFSTTLEAAALVSYLTKVRDTLLLPECLYSESEEINDGEWLLLAYINGQREFCPHPIFNKTSALTVASILFGVNADNIRKYDGPAAADDKAEAGVALFGLTRLGLLKTADRYFDVEELITTAVTYPIPVTI